MDIGAHLGYFCHRFEELGHECVAVESHADICYFLRKLHASRERKFRIVEESIFSFVERERPVFDRVLALSILHHFLKDESAYHQLVKLLNTLQTEEMIFEPHNPAEPQMRGVFRNFDCDAFAKFILENSRLTQVEKIGIEIRPRNFLTFLNSLAAIVLYRIDSCKRWPIAPHLEHR